jgi:hypothetical protein
VFVISAVHTISAVTVTASGDLPLGQITSGYADQGDMKVSCFRAQLTTAAALNPVVTLTADASVGPWATLVLTYVPDPITSASQNLHDINTYNYAALPDIGLTVPADEPSLGSGEDYVYLGFHATNNTARTVTPSLGWITGGTVASTEAADNVGITWQHRHGQGEPVRPDAATDAPGDWWISFAHAIFVAEPSTAITPATPTPEDPG